MILTLFALLLGLSLVLIAIGLTKQDESAAALIGFLFLFLLSFVILGNNLEYEIGEQRNVSYSYDNSTGENLLNKTTEDITLIYTTWDDTTGIFNTHRFGYFLAIASIIGFAGVLMSLKGGWKRE